MRWETKTSYELLCCNILSLQWSETEPVVSLRYACGVHSNLRVTGTHHHSASQEQRHVKELLQCWNVLFCHLCGDIGIY